jgi:hypothetical protein
LGAVRSTWIQYGSEALTIVRMEESPRAASILDGSYQSIIEIDKE